MDGHAHLDEGLAERYGSFLARFDAILLRQDPPFDMGYITATHLLEAIHPKTLVVNDPAALSEAEKQAILSRCLELAIEGETYEYTTMYPEFAAQARTDRAMAISPACAASFGNTPVFHVTPLIVSGLNAVGVTPSSIFRSKVSVWLGAPVNSTNRTLSAVFLVFTSWPFTSCAWS